MHYAYFVFRTQCFSIFLLFGYYCLFSLHLYKCQKKKSVNIQNTMFFFCLCPGLPLIKGSLGQPMISSQVSARELHPDRSFEFQQSCWPPASPHLWSGSIRYCDQLQYLSDCLQKLSTVMNPRTISHPHFHYKIIK